MEDKEKQIKEIVKLLYDKNASIVWWDYYNDDYNPSYKDELKNVAKIIYNAGYRKLPKDSVVLTKEEYENLTIPRLLIKPRELNQKELAEKLKNEKYGIISVDQSSIEIIPSRVEIEKETAEKIESELKAFIKVWKMAEDDAMSIAFYRALFEKIGELAKQFGVEIKE